MLQKLIDIIVREGNLHNKNKCEPCGQNASGYGNLGYVFARVVSARLVSFVKA